MSILAKNIKTIRKELGCTQTDFADIVRVGFRTYVRYEAGERDAPVSVLVKIAKVANMSLERMLTVEVHKPDILPAPPSLQVTVPEVKRCHFRVGQIEFKKPSSRRLLTVDDAERKLLGFFRRMPSSVQKELLESVKKLGKGIKGKGSVERPVKSPGKPERTVPKNTVVEKVKVKMTPARNRGRGRPKRGRQDEKLIKEKIDRLKMLTKSINKITVR